ncbi:MAG: hypothetical protein A3J54_01540 [Candidatus Ryanbacteria bacterium RIFCSPHIGHO2_02_FULL_45_13b]|uniref:VanZ-like domain-containing protein n=1 Tax=Candidatus Ryanbacteria bacterium RIFCSPHIGHO2_02_FULL_45_13b TaxID=1802117 RepID=A0A1G2GBI0_9BACT|nr:MAG: hypothetical protein A3J54_01540 [Candidatus Ryanbacteria bacterium RIFCSPHIGHO2_02_FULL_45_13b]
MNVRPSAWSVLVGVLAILCAHILSVLQGWYTTYTWIDIPLHLAGGAWTALAFFYLQRRYVLLFSALPFLFSIIMVVGVVMLVGVGWEWFEFGFDYIFVPEHAEWRAQFGLVDTMGDLLADVIGGALVGLYFLLNRKQTRI